MRDPNDPKKPLPWWLEPPNIGCGQFFREMLFGVGVVVVWIAVSWMIVGGFKLRGNEALAVNGLVLVVLLFGAPLWRKAMQRRD